MMTYPLHGGQVGKFPGRQVVEVTVAEAAFDVETSLLFFTSRVLGAVETLIDDGQLAVGRPAGELGPVMRLFRQPLGKGAPVLSVCLDNIGPHRGLVGMTAP